MAAPSPVPGAPPALRGVLNVHGAVVPVVDVRARLGLPSRPLGADAHLVLARAGDRLVALEVDRVLEIREVAEADVEPRGAWGGGSPLVAGAVKLGDGVALVQALDALADVGAPAAAP
jgi:purine-binding chemotaxis protein CheW